MKLITEFSIGGVASALPDATNQTNRGNQNYAKQSRHIEQHNITTFYLVSFLNKRHNNHVYHHNDNEEDNPTDDKTNRGNVQSPAVLLTTMMRRFSAVMMV